MANHTRKATTCSVDGCEKGGYMSRGLCAMHHARLRRTGETGDAKRQWDPLPDSCSVSDCQRPPMARGYCLAHYKRLRRWGDPLGSRPTIPASDRFWSKVVQDGDCWRWTGTIGNHRYGIFHPSSGTQELAHRWSYEHMVGDIPAGLHIDHLCRNRWCVNPYHMDPVTHLVNLARGAGYAILNGMRDSCIHGHKYTPENTYTSPKGDIRCRECGRQRDRERVAA